MQHRAVLQQHERIHAYRLDNGLELLTIQRREAPVASCRLFVASGSRFDHGRRGRAHLTEHCLASGAMAGHQPVEVALERAGAELEASTHREYMHFGVNALSGDLPAALAALGQICAKPALDPQLVQREQRIILRELDDYHDSLEALWDVFFSALWNDHPLVHPSIGGPEVRNLALDDVAEHWRTTMQPNRGVLAVVSAFEPDEVSRLAQRCFGDWQSGGFEGGTDGPPVPRSQPGRYRLPANLQQAYFILGWPVPPAGNEKDTPLRILTTMLGGGPSSLLVRRLRSETAAVYQVQAMLPQFSDGGALAVSGSCAPEQIDEVLGAVVEVVAGNGKPPCYRQDDLRLCLASYRGALVRQYETAGERAGLLGKSGLLGHHRAMQDRLAAADQVTVEQLEELSHALFRKVPPAVAVLG